MRGWLRSRWFVIFRRFRLKKFEILWSTGLGRDSLTFSAGLLSEIWDLAKIEECLIREGFLVKKASAVRISLVPLLGTGLIILRKTYFRISSNKNFLNDGSLESFTRSSVELVVLLIKEVCGLGYLNTLL